MMTQSGERVVRDLDPHSHRQHSHYPDGTVLVTHISILKAYAYHSHCDMALVYSSSLSLS
jgi:hypothetical protein